MITLDKIRELIKQNDEALDNIIAQYFIQKHLKEKKDEKIKIDCELDTYMKSVKSHIESLINENKLEDAKEVLKEYKNVIEEDISIYSIEGIILLQEGNVELAKEKFKKGLAIDIKNIDLNYNMAYVNMLLGNIEEAIYYYNKCLNLSEDEELITEINNIIYEIQKNNLNIENKSTVVTIDIDGEDILFEQLCKKKYNVIRIKSNDDLEKDYKYEEDGKVVYELHSSKIDKELDSIIENNMNCVVIFGKFQADSINNINGRCKIAYYTNNNLYTDKNNYINNNVNIYLENELCKNSELILTNNICVYNFKKIVEKRENVYLLESSNELFNLTYVLENKESINEEKICEALKDRVQVEKNEYEKSLYLMASEFNSIDNCIQVSDYIYNRYKTQEMYLMYLSLLNEKKEYIKLSALMLNSDYCDDIYKSEIIYLNSIQEYDLIDFMVNMSIKNYTMVELSSNNNFDYKMGAYNFELNNFDNSYEKYLELVDNDNNLIHSPLVNRNLGYLMYSKGNCDYEKFYNTYKQLIACLYESECELIEG